MQYLCLVMQTKLNKAKLDEVKTNMLETMNMSNLAKLGIFLRDTGVEFSKDNLNFINLKGEQAPSLMLYV